MKTIRYKGQIYKRVDNSVELNTSKAEKALHEFSNSITASIDGRESAGTALLELEVAGINGDKLRTPLDRLKKVETELRQIRYSVLDICTMAGIRL